MSKKSEKTYKNALILACTVVPMLAIPCFIYTEYRRQKFMAVDSFIYEGIKVPLMESSYNCGFRDDRMTERCLEVPIAKIWLEKMKGRGNIIEIGAVTPYYFNVFHDVCDPADDHRSVNFKVSMFDLDLRDRNVLSISTIEHIGTGQYGLQAKKGESAVSALEKILNESQKCLITFPVAQNKELDEYVLNEKFLNLHKNITVTFFVREYGNRFVETKDIYMTKSQKRGSVGADAVVIIEKK